MILVICLSTIFKQRRPLVAFGWPGGSPVTSDFLISRPWFTKCSRHGEAFICYLYDHVWFFKCTLIALQHIQFNPALLRLSTTTRLESMIYTDGLILISSQVCLNPQKYSRICFKEFQRQGTKYPPPSLNFPQFSSITN